MSWPGRLADSERVTDIRGHSSAVGRVQDRESSLVKDQHSVAVPRNQPLITRWWPPGEPPPRRNRMETL